MLGAKEVRKLWFTNHELYVGYVEEVYVKGEGGEKAQEVSFGYHELCVGHVEQYQMRTLTEY
jgi:hypothetical protein